MIIDVTNEVLTRLKTELTGIDVVTSYPNYSPDFPIVTLTESSNITDRGTIDSSGQTHSYISLEVEIYTIGSRRMSKAKEIRTQIDTVLSGEYRMIRTFSNAIPNFLDTNVYRYKLIYSFRIDKEKTIYRG